MKLLCSSFNNSMQLESPRSPVELSFGKMVPSGDLPKKATDSFVRRAAAQPNPPRVMSRDEELRIRQENHQGQGRAVSFRHFQSPMHRSLDAAYVRPRRQH